jgi:SAM-dependent methyltransferase
MCWGRALLGEDCSAGLPGPGRYNHLETCVTDSRAVDPLAPQHVVSESCEGDLARHGDSYLGVGYTKSADEAAERYALMLGVIREISEPITLLDLGCGLGHLGDVIEADRAWAHVRYTGLDISERYLAAARTRRPDRVFLRMDVLADDAELPMFDYVVLNGVFNYRGVIPFDRMLTYWQDLLVVAFKHARLGLAFNVMSPHVDWERDDLFHLPLDTMSAFVWSRLTRFFVVRHDYRACEYVTYLYRTPVQAGR